MPAPADPVDLRRADVELAGRCMAGDRTAQRALFQREIDRVHRILHRILGRGADAEDAAQETMLALFRSLPRFRGEATLGTWVDRIAVRCALRALDRRRRAMSPLDDADLFPGAAMPADEELARRNTGRLLYAALDRLETKQRIAFVLNVLEERTAAEIAKLMGATRVATKARIWRARRELEKRARRDPMLAALLAEEGVQR